MGMTIDRELTEVEKGMVIDIMQKKAAFEAVLADVQTARATKQLEWSARENAAKTEISKLEIQLRNIRQVQE